MTVGELIEILKKRDSSKKVRLMNYDYDDDDNDIDTEFDVNEVYDLGKDVIVELTYRRVID